METDESKQRGPTQICGEKRCQEFCRWPACLPTPGSGAA